MERGSGPSPPPIGLSEASGEKLGGIGRARQQKGVDVFHATDYRADVLDQLHGEQPKVGHDVPRLVGMIAPETEVIILSVRPLVNSL
ncbi:hypothetical protein GCM10009557_55370 [Virgisporangium ochraceum]|uniref:Uncharacterized protein n=1 Tax=Virgisporangium ochraceum TaxID=65505 RepID=A0A8J3ZX81_9ACTN|nr:hypothetical protein Voc01_066460 [Virgisporangium ochraceum]